ncbi:acyltransferase family protein [Desulfosediminicola flagellatus]|uniref:acyltransferase family protein n=1 Tax=Desulfosediminicola flagellatus TaxID=2569541 RepID=UPI0010AD64DB|nr:acyltransferase family protein [Desulfosediminicola flagellatus]
MSLENSRSFRQFFYKRWLRLFPAMLIATVLIYSTTALFPDRPIGDPTLLSLLPGLSFIEPRWWEILLQSPVVPLEGAFWSLFVEMKFYLIAGLAFFKLGRRRVIPFLILLFSGSVVISYLATSTDIPLFDFANSVSHHLSLKYFGWFAAGALLYRYHATGQDYTFFAGLTVSIFSSIFVKSGFEITPIVGALVILLFFAGAIRWECLQRVFDNKIFIFFGFISYPLYLIHENAMISMITGVHGSFPSVPRLCLPLLPFILVAAVSYGIVKMLQPKCRGFINRTIQFIWLAIGRYGCTSAAKNVSR